MQRFATVADRDAVEAEKPWEARKRPVTLYGFLSEVAKTHGSRPALSFQILSGPTDKAETLSWQQLHAQVTQCANLLRHLGIGPKDTVAYMLPNALETAVVLLGGATAGIVNPINPLLEPEQVAAILRETGAKVLVTLKPFPKTDVAQKAAEAVRLAPNVKTVLEIDLNRYLTPPKSWIVPFIRPKLEVTHNAKVMNLKAEAAKLPGDTLMFEDVQEDRVAAYFHTGGTTGMPKVAQHKYSGMIYNGWLGGRLLFNEQDVMMCPLPLFHVFAAYPILMSAIASGAHVIFPTPAGYRGDGVFDNFWKLIERWKVTFLITVPTAVSAMVQRPVNADISSLRTALSGSAPLPIELYNRFKAATGVEIAEGYGLTEATCLVSVNPVDGKKKVGSVGIPLPYSHVRILLKSPEGFRECGADEVGEICVANPGVFEGSTYTEADKNHDLFAEERFLRTGDLGRIDAEGYLWITGRAKDLIIRGGHNLDPAEIEDALLSHPAVAFAGAIGQPDAFSGELPCAYVELVGGAEISVEALLAHARDNIHERAAIPKYLEIMDELPKTAVGKIFKPALRKSAITRVLNGALKEAGLEAHVASVVEDKKRGLVANIEANAACEDAKLRQVLGEFTVQWDRIS
ncbi:AMP-binding protein [Thioclava dalianensis]|uniref:AMP-binding protein n=1 Tax=Thioclava dalianensis TaxID=1185766 RepID=A0A074TM24_9RHOB|nr:acyl-CoA synthetase [Thioclava dalianensis]KEP71210.1 AMP-binding protein [Thioclava dalianensis]SFM74385.1 fatty-acyl-CoA synthase [Thioclava dalianensis]